MCWSTTSTTHTCQSCMSRVIQGWCGISPSVCKDRQDPYLCILWHRISKLNTTFSQGRNSFCVTISVFSPQITFPLNLFLVLLVRATFMNTLLGGPPDSTTVTLVSRIFSYVFHMPDKNETDFFFISNGHKDWCKNTIWRYYCSFDLLPFFTTTNAVHTNVGIQICFHHDSW
jgi:hypothetical protein